MTTLQIINLLQRITGIVALFLLTLQIFLSSSRKYTKYHILNGILTYTFVFIHPLLMIFFKYFLYHKIDPFYVFTDVCVLCDGIYEYYINFGRIALYIITITVITAKFKNNISNWVKNNWRKLHIVNYVAFYFVSIHAMTLGSDSSNKIFLIFFWTCQAIVAWIIIKKVKYFLLNKSF